MASEEWVCLLNVGEWVAVCSLSKWTLKLTKTVELDTNIMETTTTKNVKSDKQTHIITYRRQHQRWQVPQCDKEQLQGHGNREWLAVLNELLVNGSDEQHEQPGHRGCDNHDVDQILVELIRIGNSNSEWHGWRVLCERRGREAVFLRYYMCKRGWNYKLFLGREFKAMNGRNGEWGADEMSERWEVRDRTTKGGCKGKGSSLWGRKGERWSRRSKSASTRNEMNCRGYVGRMEEWAWLKEMGGEVEGKNEPCGCEGGRRESHKEWTGLPRCEGEETGRVKKEKAAKHCRVYKYKNRNEDDHKSVGNCFLLNNRHEHVS